MGRWRDNYRTGLKVDASGKLFGQHTFRDVVEFKDAVRAEQDAFAIAFVEHLLSYGLGRELTLTDRMAAIEIAKASEQDDYRMRDVIKTLCCTRYFGNRQPCHKANRQTNNDTPR